MIIRPAQPIATSNKPQTDRRAVFASVQNETGEIDLLIAQQTERFGQLRCIYIDTSAQDTDGNGCVIETDLGQNITALAQTQGYYPVFLPFVSKLKISSNQAVNILLLDFDMRPSIWPTALASSNVPDPLHVIIDDQPIATNATIGNWPAVQPVSISGQPVEVSQGSVFVTQAEQLGAWGVDVDNLPNIGSIITMGTLTTSLQAFGSGGNVGLIGVLFTGASISTSFTVQIFDNGVLSSALNFPPLSNFNLSFQVPISKTFGPMTAKLTAALTSGNATLYFTR